MPGSFECTQYKVLFDFAAVEDGELTVKTSDLVTSAPAPDTAEHESPGDTKDGWILVQDSTGDIGYVPLNYLQRNDPSNNIKGFSAGVNGALGCNEVVREDMLGSATTGLSENSAPNLVPPTPPTANRNADVSDVTLTPPNWSQDTLRAATSASAILPAPRTAASGGGGGGGGLMQYRLVPDSAASTTGMKGAAGGAGVGAPSVGRAGGVDPRVGVGQLPLGVAAGVGRVGWSSPAPSSTTPAGPAAGATTRGAAVTGTNWRAQHQRMLEANNLLPAEGAQLVEANPEPGTPVRRFSDSRLGQHLDDLAGKHHAPETATLASSVRRQTAEKMKNPDHTGLFGVGGKIDEDDPLASIRDKNYTPLGTLKKKGYMGTSSTGKRPPHSALRSAVKGVQNALKVAHRLPQPKVPSLSTNAATGDFTGLLEKNEEFFEGIIATRTEALASLLQLGESLSRQIEDSHKLNSNLTARLAELEGMVDEERRSYKYMVHDDTEANVREQIALSSSAARGQASTSA